MPNNNFETEYKEWLSGHMAPDVYVIDTIHIYGTVVGNNYFARHATPINATLETGPTVQFQAIQFEITLPNTQTGSQQRMEIVVPGQSGQVYKQLRRMDVYDRTQPLYITHRVYLSNDFSKPMINPPTNLQVRTVAAGKDAVAIQVAAPQWPNRQAGRYYNIENYPGLINV